MSGKIPIQPPDLAEIRPGQMAKGDALKKSIDPRILKVPKGPLF